MDNVPAWLNTESIENISTVSSSTPDNLGVTPENTTTVADHEIPKAPQETTSSITNDEEAGPNQEGGKRTPLGEIPDKQTLNDPMVELNTKIYDKLEEEAIDNFSSHMVTSIA